jgi:hypothetical protein
VTHTIRVLLESELEFIYLRNRPRTRVSRRCGRTVERADLDANAAGLELRQPVALEEALPAATEDEVEGSLLPPADHGLEQEVVVGVDDQRGPV